MLTDPSVFAPEYQPQRLPHRSSEYDQLIRALDPATQGDRAADILIHGPHGVGKTALLRHLLQELATESAVQQTVVDCLGLTTAGIVRATLEGLGADPAPNTPREDLCLQLREWCDRPTIVVLDEADDVPDTAALARLWDAPAVSVVAICHDRDTWLAYADAATRHRFRMGTMLGMDAYDEEELVDILTPRTARGLRSDAVTDTQLRQVARQADGDARTAIRTLHAAADIATERGHDQLRRADIPAGYERAKRRIRETNLSSLAFHHHVLYELIRAAGRIAPQTLHNRYEAVADTVYSGVEQTPIGGRARRYKLEKLRAYDLIVFAGSNQYTDEYEVCDPDVASPIEIAVPREIE